MISIENAVKIAKYIEDQKSEDLSMATDEWRLHVWLLFRGILGIRVLISLQDPTS